MSQVTKDAAYGTLLHDLGQEIIDACLEMNRQGINQGTSGNISARVPSCDNNDTFLITPSGVPYCELTPNMLVLIKVTSEGEEPEIIDKPLETPSEKKFPPSTEWRMHRDIYVLKEEAKAIVHAHPTFSTILSCLRLDIPAFHYMIAAAGGPDIRCTPYHTFGTRALADAMQIALEDRYACLLGNHGMICFSEKSISKALWLAGEVETLARQYFHVLQLSASLSEHRYTSSASWNQGSSAENMTMFLLDENEMKIIKEKFKTYGQPRVESSKPSKN